jgi:hypothetical protein
VRALRRPVSFFRPPVDIPTQGRSTVSKQGILTMIVILGLVWGGFLLILLKAVRKERHKGP